MLAVLGFLGLAMSSFVMLGKDDTEADLPPEDSNDPADTGLTDIGDGFYQMLSDTDGDAGAGAVLADDTVVSDELADADDSTTALDDSIDTIASESVSDPEDDPDTDYGDDLVPDLPSETAIIGTDADDRFVGTREADEFVGSDGDDRMAGKMGADRLFGGDGNDAMTGGAGDDALYGGAGHDALAGGWGDDSLVGGDGRDLLNGGAGNDVLDGRDDDNGFDYLNGGAGDDLLLAGAGDHLNGGEGSDTFAVTTDGANTIDDFDPQQDVLEVTYIGDTPPVLTTTTDDEGLTLMADDTVVAHLLGVATLDMSSVVLTAA